MSDPRENFQQPEDDGSLHHWMMCEEEADERDGQPDEAQEWYDFDPDC